LEGEWEKERGWSGWKGRVGGRKGKQEEKEKSNATWKKLLFQVSLSQRKR